MVTTTDTAPDFTLPGYQQGEAQTYSLRETTERGNAVLLLFYPFDFSPVCSTQLCALRDAEWFEFLDDVAVWGVSSDSVYAHSEFAEQRGITFPLLSDSDGSVATAFGSVHDRLYGHRNVPERAVYVIDDESQIQYQWVAESASMTIDFEAVHEALEETTGQAVECATPEIAAAFEYDEAQDPMNPSL